MATATLNGGKQAVETTEEEKPKRSNPLMRKLEPEMYKNPYPLELIGGKVIASDQLCYQRGATYIFEPLGFKSEKECTDYAKAAWKWIGLAEERRQEELAQNLFAQAQEDSKVMAKLKLLIEAA